MATGASIAKSAGSAVIEAIATDLSEMPNPPVIQETFLDPYTGHFLEGRHEYGQHADWAENYFAVDLETDAGGTRSGGFIREIQLPYLTSGPMDSAHNVTWRNARGGRGATPGGLFKWRRGINSGIHPHKPGSFARFSG